MPLTKEIAVNKIETVKKSNYFVLQVQNKISVLEDGNELSYSLDRYSLTPNADVSTITDPVVKAQFEAVMTQEVKDNYATFLASPNEEEGESE